MEPYVIVVFIHNTVKSYEIVSYNQVVQRFEYHCFKNVGLRADLDCRSHFASYSDDKIMVQVIGFINRDLTEQLYSAIRRIEDTRRRNWWAQNGFFLLEKVNS